jgi:two-component system nitrogen regulation response regulator NtrX
MKHDVLIVDDEAPVRELLSEYFKQKGFDARTAESAQAAKDELGRHRPSVVILDMALGDADGLMLLEEIRKQDAALPVIMLTGMGFDNELLDEALKKGANGYMSKMLPLDQLLMEVHRILNKASAGGPAKPQ